jgi:hypothetical protein
MDRSHRLPRKSYYTEDYCRKHRRRFRTTIELAAAMLRELRAPDDVDVVVKVQLLPGQSAEWWDYHRAPVSYRREDGRKPARWHRKVLACTDPTATARQVVECYVLMKFEAVERYLDLLLMGLLLLEQQRLRTTHGRRRLLRELHRQAPCQVA